jgi:hypothetical protein
MRVYARRSASVATAIVFEIASEALELSERVDCSSIDNFKSASDWHLGKVSINLISRNLFDEERFDV